ncbi:MAG: sensor domain-containing diguanylate cyclase [Bacteroidetes bacterium]|nr:sensor domain-containing diguanylate cyclase [Bacteroidota bacterium]
MDIPIALTEKVISSLHDGVYITDKERIIRYWNYAAERITGFSSNEVVGKSCSDNILLHVNTEGKNLCVTGCPLAQSIQDNIPREADVFLHHKSGHRVPVNVRVSVILNDKGEVTHAIELFTDISSKNITEIRIKELERAALLDQLTQLANRYYIESEIGKKLEDFRKHSIPFGVFFIDIDHFKRVNDTYGHDAGDQILKLTADSLLANAEPFDIFGRWGGEEFIGLIQNVEQQTLASMGNQLRVLVENSFIEIDNKPVSITISIGATVVRENDTAESIIKRADKLMYRSKDSGRNRLTIG